MLQRKHFSKKSFNTAPVLPQFCPNTAPVMPQYCPSTAPILPHCKQNTHKTFSKAALWGTRLFLFGFYFFSLLVICRLNIVDSKKRGSSYIFVFDTIRKEKAKFKDIEFMTGPISMAELKAVRKKFKHS